MNVFFIFIFYSPGEETDGPFAPWNVGEIFFFPTWGGREALNKCGISKTWGTGGGGDKQVALCGLLIIVKVGVGCLRKMKNVNRLTSSYGAFAPKTLQLSAKKKNFSPKRDETSSTQTFLLKSVWIFPAIGNYEEKN